MIDPSLHRNGCFWVGRHLAQTDYQALSCKFRDESKLISMRIAAAAERAFAQDSIGTLLNGHSQQDHIEDASSRSAGEDMQIAAWFVG